MRKDTVRDKAYNHYRRYLAFHIIYGIQIQTRYEEIFYVREMILALQKSFFTLSMRSVLFDIVFGLSKSLPKLESGL